jgi:luciferase family oxidoreductase group 1
MKLSILDLSVVQPGGTRHEAFDNSHALAQRAEEWGYSRFWVAEHHGTPTAAGRAPEVLIASLAAHTSRIRLGSGSVLLNHYSPLKVAELFCTLNEIYPGRIDLGIGRATTGPVTDFALQQDRTRAFHSDSSEQLVELLAWLEGSFPDDHAFAAHPLYTDDSLPEVHLLGSSPWSASAAAQLGLRYSFASFINQDGTPGIIRSYRNNFQPSSTPTGVDRPTLMIALRVICADTELEARRQFAPVQLMHSNITGGSLRAPMSSPDDAIRQLGRLPELQRYEPGSGVPPRYIGGTIEQVRETLEQISNDLGADEIIIQDMMTDFEARLRSFELLSALID